MAADGRDITPNHEIREEAVFANVISYFLFGNVVKPGDCPLPGNKDVLIMALTDPLGFRHHISIWVPTYEHYVTAVRILELADEHLESRYNVGVRPAGPPSSNNLSSITIGSPAAASTKAKKTSSIEKKEWFSVLHLATAQGKINFVERLLARPGVNVDTRNVTGDTPLSVAVFRGDMGYGEVSPGTSQGQQY